MSERRIDRDAWAALVRKLVTGRSRGNKSAFARTVGVTARTLDRWLDAQVDVSEASVRAVARALDLNAMDLLVGVGYYRADDVGRRPAQAADEVDEVIELVATDDRLTPDQKQQIIDMILDRRDRERAAERAEAERLIKFFTNAAT